MRVQMRILRARGAVLIRGGDEAGAALADHAVLAPARHARPLLEIGERRLPGGEMRLVHRVTHLVVAERVQEADALRRREHQVVPGHRRERLHLEPALTGRRVDPLDRDLLPGRMPAELSGRERMLAADQPPQLALADDAVELELRRTTADPDAGRLAAARVVVVDPGSDGALVVGLLARRQLRHRQHRGTLASRMHMCLLAWLCEMARRVNVPIVPPPSNDAGLRSR